MATSSSPAVLFYQRRKKLYIQFLKRLLIVGVPFCFVLCAAAPADAEVCAENEDVLKVCFQWDGEEFDPVIGDDVEVNFGCTGCGTAPAIELTTARTTWRVWSVSLEPGLIDDPASIGPITTTGDGDYEVTIAEPTPWIGAINVGSAVLTPPNDNYSIIKPDSRISGDIGDITVQKDSGGSGGELSLEVLGSVNGNVSVQTLTDLKVNENVIGDVSVAGAIISLEIAGNLDGRLRANRVEDSAVFLIGGDVTSRLEIEIVDFAYLIIDGNVTSTGLIDIATASTASAYEFLIIGGDLDGDIVLGTVQGVVSVYGSVGTTSTITVDQFVPFTVSGLSLNENAFQQVPGTWTFAGDIVLTNGLSTQSFVAIWGETTHSASIDLKGNTMGGALVLGQGGYANIMSGPVIGNGLDFVFPPVLLGTAPSTYSGTATFASVAAGSTILLSGTDLAGTVSITNDMDGTILFEEFAQETAELLDDGLIDIGGSLNGTITLDSGAAGDIQIAGDMLNSVSIDGALEGTGMILVDGLCDGEISIGESTSSLSQIVLGGLGSNGSIVINADEDDHNAEGDITVGDGANIVVAFDGCISILDNGSGSYGDLDGDITVYGCHATDDDLNICVEGDTNGYIRLYQSGCGPQVGVTCGTCP